jgi:ribosomal protein S18 acetylase RimI-like enzyme
MSFIITQATRADIPAMMALNAASMPEHYTPQFWTVHFNQFGDMLFVAKVDSEVIGYVLCREETVNTIRTGLVISIAVDPHYRRLGVGEELMKRAHFAMRERRVAVASLQVRKSNASAIAMYAKMGYKANLSIPGYYTNPPEDGWLMTFVL